ncbi:FMN-dependent NADH-azoreductase [Cognatishimia activa]|uniref:FMN dependent NADH:quinone oxidoreductase n=1 Tax=Cognatishimia activa TaxID=1715691 RepID=A0A0N7MC57_9RHOB|nr:NAD(P)H-dependent oxidoreductase [Cognatishimia activa]CUI46750.1 FMN-dependent NADH-azoreductase [Cognatishimia activa]CUK27280.1 FMN-dependent NADH-azoreductase [Cognatishimia activa]
MPHTVLHLDASARHQGSVSRKLSADIVAQENAGEIIRRDLTDGVPLLNENWVAGTFTPPESRSDAQNETLSFSDTLVSEVQAADTIVIGTPIYNFNIPASLKAWLDQIARAGVTFQYTEDGPKGLLEGKKVIVAIASGGTQVGSDYDFASPYLKFALGFLGITDVTVLDKDAVQAAAA